MKLNVSKNSRSFPTPFNKLAQSGTAPSSGPAKADFLAKPFEKIQTDTDIKKNTKNKLSAGCKRANAKYFTRHLQKLLYYGNPASPLRKSYLNTYYCTHAIEYKEGKEFTTYCKNRWCLPCSRIRTAQYITGYLPQISEMPAPQLVTLTRRNVTGDILKDEISGLIKNRAAIMHSEKMHNRRNGLEKSKALWKIEITYNATREDFHPHFHLIVPTPEIGDRILSRWMALEDNRGKVSLAGQDIRPVENDGAAKEIFKYFTKLLNKDEETGKYKIYPATVLNTMFEAMRRRQVYTNYGLKKPDDPDYTTSPPENLDANFYHFFLWRQNLADWIEQETGELLTGNKPRESIKSIFEK